MVILVCGKSKVTQKGLTPAIGASPDFSCPTQKSFIGRNKNFCNTNKKTEILASLSVYDLTKNLLISSLLSEKLW